MLVYAKAGVESNELVNIVDRVFSLGGAGRAGRDRA
jgi:hypothetical protein